MTQTETAHLGIDDVRGAANRLLRLTADERARGSQHTGSVTRLPQRCGPARTARSGRSILLGPR